MQSSSLRIAAPAMALLLASAFATRIASAQGNSSTSAAPAASALPSPPASAPGVSIAPAPSASAAPEAAVSPSSEDSLTVGGTKCVAGEHAGIEADDLHTTLDVVCHSLASHRAQPGVYEVRVGKLGGKLLFSIVSRTTGDERRVFIQGVDEVPVAADRLVDALVNDKSVAETERVDNVVSSESTTPKQKKVQPGVFLGMTAMTAAGIPATPSAGVDVTIQFRLNNLTLLGTGRLGGIGSADDQINSASLGAGARYFFTDSDIAPFAGGGFDFAYFNADRRGSDGMSGSGFGGYAEVGFGFFRSSHVGALVGVRADLPMFTLKGSDYSSDPNNGFSYTTTNTSRYIVPLSLTVGLTFQ